MAEEYQFSAEGHKSIYTDNPTERKYNIYFSTPSAGVNEDTGILLLIAGFGGHSNSNVYKKMRNQFADEYNLVTVQCDYFGYEFMQSITDFHLSEKNTNFHLNQFRMMFSDEDMNSVLKKGQIDLDELMVIGSKYDVRIRLDANLDNENINNFNEMGLIQAIDNLSAILRVMSILYENEYIFNAKKVIIYGQSHGAYLAYLVNVLAPSLITLIIDNSAWLFPKYLLESNRMENFMYGRMKTEVVYDYIAKKIVQDKSLLNLATLYKKFKNTCKIISFHGEMDTLITLEDKKAFAKDIDNIELRSVGLLQLDDVVFKSAKHGLDADYFKLFNHVMLNLEFEFEKNSKFILPQIVILESIIDRYCISYEKIIPEIILDFK